MIMKDKKGEWSHANDRRVVPLRKNEFISCFFLISFVVLYAVSVRVYTVRAAPSILIPSSAKIGETLTLRGTGYHPEVTVWIHLRNPNLETPSHEWLVTTNQTGSYTLNIIVPEVEFLPYYLLESGFEDKKFTSSYLLVLPIEGFSYRNVTSGDTVNENTVMTGFNKVEGAPIGINIGADDVVLICESPDIVLEGTYALSFGINVADFNNVSIYGFNISDCGVGIRLARTSDCVIEHCVITDTVSGIDMGQLGGTGVIDNNVVYHNVLERVDNGVSAYPYTNTEIKYNSFKEVKYSVYIRASDNAVISNNIFDGLDKPYGSWGVSIDDYSHNNLVYKNTISNLGFGVRILYSNDNVVTHNYIDNTVTAVQIAFMSRDNRVEYNTMQYSSYGLYVASPYNNVSYNDIMHNIQEGIRIEYTDHINVLNNNIVNNTGKGILMQSGSGFHVIENNTIDNNGQIGILLGLEPDTNITNNVIINHDIGLRFGQARIYNNIISNTINTDRCEGNTFYIEPEPGPNIIGGPDIGGNYWDDYSGSDANGDGFGDTPYESDGVYDEYPLVRPHMTVIEPNGGETLGIGYTYKIKWESNCEGKVGLYLKMVLLQPPYAERVVFIDSTENDGEYDWTPSLISGQDLEFYIIIESSEDPSFSDISDNPFFISDTNNPAEYIPGDVGWWTADGDPYDISMGNHGELRNGAYYAIGKVGQAFSFDGIDDEIIAPDERIHNIQDLTIEGWVYLNSLPNRIQRFVTLSPNLGRAEVSYGGFNKYAGQLHFSMKIGDENSPRTHLAVDNVLNEETWHHIAATYDGTHMRLFLDGSEINSIQISGPVVVGGDPAVRLSSSAEPLGGMLDEISIYNRALTLEEIQSIQDAGISGKEKPFPIFGEVITESFTLGRNLWNCPEDGLIIGASNIYIFGNGYHISGSGIGSGITIEDQEHVYINELYISGFNKGINIYGDVPGSLSFPHVISTNCIRENQIGIFIMESEGNAIVSNRIEYNGVGISVSSVGVFNNSINRNFIWENDLQIQDNGENKWKYWFTDMGNFWSDYVGLDNGANGRPIGDHIGDTLIPHPQAEKVDNYPVVTKSALGPLLGYVPTSPILRPIIYPGLKIYGGFSPVEIEIIDPDGNKLSKDVNEIGPNAYYMERDDLIPDEKVVMAVIDFITDITIEGTYTFKVTALADLDYWLEWIAYDNDTILYHYSVENVPMSEGETKELYLSVELTVDPDTGEIILEQAYSPPEILVINAPIDPVKKGEMVSVSADFRDPRIISHTATWNWGDETSSIGEIVDYTISGDHVYGEPGVYTITLTMTDDDGGSDSEIYQYIVVYDPEGGFVTGGGWIDSPEGAYTPNPTLTGKATFGFVSKYVKGTNTPIGNTEFVFHAGDLEFHSGSYEWMVIAGTKAKYKGTGTINGEGEFDFMLSAIDGDSKDDPDLFRIKIWDRVSGGVVYDNKMGSDDDGYEGTALGGGNIKVHKG